jgi:group I intron endonuclease
MTGHIYLIRNLVNGKGYVGKTELSVDCRYSQHLRNASAFVNTALYRAIRKHGTENFSVEEVASCDSSLLNDLERHYIKLTRARPAPQRQEPECQLPARALNPLLKPALRYHAHF